MANGLFSSESLPVTPKLRHVSNDSNSENTPPEVLATAAKHCNLVCNEVIDEKELQKPHHYQQQPFKNILENYNHPPVESKIDPLLLHDDRVLQNLLRNEERYLPSNPDYFTFIQIEIKPHMRKLVVSWMFDVCTDSCQDTPEVFTLAVNFLDRFLAVCRISTNQFQLLGAACLFLASKFKALEHITSDKLVMFTDYSITIQELKEWELLILQKLRWELSSTTALDYLDHVIPRLYLPAAVDEAKLRRMTESVISYASMEYSFAYRRASLLTATSILFSLQECLNLSQAKQQLSPLESRAVEKIIRDAGTCLQILTHTGSEELEKCCLSLAQTLPDHLLPSSSAQPSVETRSPDSTVIIQTEEQPGSTITNQDFTSAVDVFSDFNTSVLEAVLSPNDSFSSILVS